MNMINKIPPHSALPSILSLAALLHPVSYSLTPVYSLLPVSLPFLSPVYCLLSTVYCLLALPCLLSACLLLLPPDPTPQTPNPTTLPPLELFRKSRTSS